MYYTKHELLKTAENLCMPLINRTAKRLRNSETNFTVDRAGFACSELENICRGFMGASAVEKYKPLTVSDGINDFSLLDWWSETLLNGCDETNPLGFERGRKSMGDNFFYNQSITEICCMLVFSYLSKEKFWNRLDLQKKDLLLNKILVWAEKALEDSWQNNHLWFPILSLVVLKQLGYKSVNYEANIEKALCVLDKMYIGEGWYQDGEFGRFDYYVGWSLHLYPLWWSVLESDDFPNYATRKSEYIKRTEQFLPYYMHWFDNQGANVMFGRSLSYKFAAVSLIPAAVLAGCNFDFGSAKKLMFDNINFYTNHCTLTQDNVLPTGIFYENRAFVESYTSDGGAYWCAKTFFALFIPDEHPFWTTSICDYASQKAKYIIYPDNKRVNIGFANTADTGVTMFNNTSNYVQNDVFLHPFNDMASYYSKFTYNSLSGFAISSRDLVSFDNMISIKTSDNIMQSHRHGFKDLGIKDNILYSSHYPFSNDATSYIITAVLPLCGSTHIRLHKVVLGKQYIVREGGFSIPFYEDDFSFNTVENNYANVRNANLISLQKCVGNVELKQYMEMPKPGNHAYAPMCGYPAYETNLLDKGTYWFAGVYCVSNNKSKHLDDINLCLINNGVQICQGGNTYVVCIN